MASCDGNVQGGWVNNKSEMSGILSSLKDDDSSSTSPDDPILTSMSSTSSYSSSHSLVASSSNQQLKLHRNNNDNNIPATKKGTVYVGISTGRKRRDDQAQSYTSSICWGSNKLHLGSYYLKSDAALAYDKATHKLESIRGKPTIANFSSLKDYELAKKAELNKLSNCNDNNNNLAMTSTAIEIKVKDIVSKHLPKLNGDISGNESDDFELSDDNNEDEDVSEVDYDNNIQEGVKPISTTDKDVATTKKKNVKAKLSKKDKKWQCYKCHDDVRLPPPSTVEDSSSLHEYLNTTHVMCALKCSNPRYHLSCSGVPKGSHIYRNAVICCQSIEKSEESLPNNKCDVKQVLEHLYSSRRSVWWSLSTDTKILIEGRERSFTALQNDKNLATSMLSFTCPKCDVEGASRYLLEYFEEFTTMKQSFYADYLNIKDNDMVCRRDRADESVLSRTGEAFLWHLMKDNRNDYLNKNEAAGDTTTIEKESSDWRPSEIQLTNMGKIVTYLSKQLQRQQQQQRQRRQKRQKVNFRLDPSYLVGMPIRLYNPIDNSYHSGRIIDCKFNAPHKVDQPISNLKSSENNTPIVPNIEELIDWKISKTLYLVRFREGVDGRNIAVHEWIYLEEHAVTVGGNVCWAKVGDDESSNGDDTMMTDDTTNMDSSNEGAKKPSDDYVSPYRPVQLLFRSMLEMIPLQQLNPKDSSSLNVLAVGFGHSVGHIRLSLSDSGANTRDEQNNKGSGKESTLSSTIHKQTRPVAIPLTSSNPSWLDKILQRAQLTDEDVALGLAMACMEKEEERRIRTWRQLTVSHLFQPSPMKSSRTTPLFSPKRRPASQFITSPTNFAIKKSRLDQPSKSNHLPDTSLEGAAKSGCNKCIDELNSGIKTALPHDKSCSRKRHYNPPNENNTPGTEEPMKKKMKKKRTKKKDEYSGLSPQAANVMRRYKEHVRAGDPRPVSDCNWCGNGPGTSAYKERKGGTQNLCSTCDDLRNEGWNMTAYTTSRKRRYDHTDGRSVWSAKEFLIETTDFVAKKKAAE